MKYLFTPIDVLSLPNDFTDKSQWSVSAGTGETLYFQLQVDDSLGLRRYIPGASDTVKLVFMRARSSTLGVADTAQTFEVSCTANTQDRSLWSCTLTTAQVGLLISGTVQMKLTSGTTVYTYNRSYAIKKIVTDAGC